MNLLYLVHLAHDTVLSNADLKVQENKQKNQLIVMGNRECHK